MATQPPSKKESMKASNIPLSGSDHGATFNWLMLSNPEYAATFRNHSTDYPLKFVFLPGVNHCCAVTTWVVSLKGPHPSSPSSSITGQS